MPCLKLHSITQYYAFIYLNRASKVYEKIYIKFNFK